MADNCFGLTDIGKVRDNNEDAFIAQSTTSGFVIACVIDGVGGYTGGEVATAIAREEIIKRLNNAGDNFILNMVESFRQANKSIYNRKQQEKELDSMACVCTLAIVDVERNQFYYAHVGDTRLYLLRDGSLVKISKDQSFVGFLEDSGRLSESDAMNHPKRNEINKALGFDNQVDTDDTYIETGQSPFLPGDMLLLCSDGLSDLVDKSKITSIITQNTSLQEKASKLIAAANNNGGKDNITVVLVQNNKEPQRLGATMPASVIKKKDSLTEKELPVNQPQNLVTNTSVVSAQSKKGNGLTIVLALLCILLLASSVWLYIQWQSKGKIANTAVGTVVKKQRNATELKLQQAIDSVKSDTLVLSDTAYAQPIIISDTLHVNKDTLYIKGNLVLKCDSGYNGPALALASTCKSMVLEGLRFQDFNTAIHLNNNEFYLRKVQFINCFQPIQNVYTFDNNKLITSAFPYITYRADSVTNTTIKPDGTR